ncbi:Rossmann-like and DUF2520 domain-containing protein [Polaribacter porphyrae]|uniref:DUF2520 domain-containing protein n=1 Tax=Polaribacter porphyrae TaxID=1137780 RepID=A0A2S7WLE4_9FLAO|nr:DUF2520 domain-containing protein [Polaribacter porphyrae]PQJ78393.1 hypothetical protein BTO18_03935 [Polaribacter porphyrae]
MITVLVVGTGNVATHLYNAFFNIDNINVSQISSRNLKNIPNTDVTIIAVSDDAIAEVSSKINNPFVVHTSGSISMKNLQNSTRKGVFYMLQTFTKEKKVDFKKVPFCLEAEHKDDLKILKKLAKTLGNSIYTIDSNQRKALHVAAVFVNNFTNHLYKIGHDICLTHNVPFKVLHPLIQETSNKIMSLPPIKAQTGPAIRNDTKTIKNHLTLLEEQQQKIYKILTKSIQDSLNR